MGFCSWFAGKCSAVYGGIKRIASECWDKAVEVVSDACDGIKKGARWVGNQVSKAWKNFSGETIAEQAEKRYAELEATVRKKEAEFSEYAKRMEDSINAELKKINEIRVDLSERCFERYETIASNFANLEVVGIVGDRAVKAKSKKIALKAKSSLFKIDFKNHPVKTNLQALLTLGFWTRKRAKESLQNVEAEEIRVQKDFAALDAEKVRLEGVLSSLKSVVRYLTSTTERYERILDELDYSVLFLRSCRRVVSRGAVLRSVFDVEFLPERQLLTLMCADKATRILHKIASQKYVKAEGKSFAISERDLKVWETEKAELAESLRKMAA